MKDSTKNKIEGGLHEAKGSVKEATGKAVGNPRLEGKGMAEKVAGKVQKTVGKVQDKTEEDNRR